MCDMILDLIVGRRALHLLQTIESHTIEACYKFPDLCGTCIIRVVASEH